MASGRHRNPHRSITCDADGWFEAPVPPDGEVFLAADPGDAAFSFPAGLGMLRIATDASSLSDGIRVTLIPRGRASGIVLDPEGGPVAGAAISFAVKTTEEGPMTTAPHLGTSRTMSGPDGRFSLEGLPVGTTLAAVAAKVPFRKGLSSPFRIPEGGTVDGIEIRLLPGCAITGLVTDPAGAPLPGAQVRVTTGSTTRRAGPIVPADLPDEAVAGPDGRYRIEGLEQRPYSVFATLEGHTPADLTGIHATAAGTEAAPLVLVRGGVLRGIVVDAEDHPLPGASISLQGGNRSGGTATTDADGRFEIRPVLPGPHTLFAGKAGFVHRPPEDLELAGGEEVRVVLERGLEIAGTVLDLDGRPVPQARVRVHPLPPKEAEVLGVTMTDPRGRFSVGGLSSGSHGISVAAAGHVFPDFPPVAAGTSTLELRSARSVFIAGRVLDPEGAPFADAWVEIADAGGVRPPDPADPRRFRRLLTDGEGAFRAEGLLGGPFRILVRARDDLQEESLRDVPGDSDGLVLRMRRRELR
ncbi:MAG: carboxypeptidase regulatory-like domain-containing protein [Planctomycetaceae bacterium]|nr:carboxypeptidase regulatory-like domain-containing protein [Planctomycetota bacterium]NUN52818.1 carboxypeptidase regulatory-like domain-containing protein [Planctomycetaceae bacterium]